MTLPVVLRRTAEDELDRAAAWYATKREKLAAEFVAEVKATFAVIAEHPDRFGIAHEDVREAQLDRFPYCVYYRVLPERVLVLAVFHTARDPSIWQSRS